MGSFDFFQVDYLCYMNIIFCSFSMFVLASSAFIYNFTLYLLLCHVILMLDLRSKLVPGRCSFLYSPMGNGHGLLGPHPMYKIY